MYTLCKRACSTASVSLKCMRKIFIGDVHGCYDELMLLLTQIEHNSATDELYFVGDLVSKGRHSNRVIEFVRTTSNCFSVMGPHDYHLLRASHFLNTHPVDVVGTFKEYRNVSQKEMSSYLTTHSDIVAEISTENLIYLSKMPLFISAHPKINVVHAGIVPGIDIWEQSPWVLMLIRNTVDNQRRKCWEATLLKDVGFPWIQMYNGPEHIFFGHDAQRLLQISGYASGLDTGCCYGGYLTAAIVSFDYNQQVLSAENEAKYDMGAWHQRSQIYKSKAGFIYRLAHIKAFDTYMPIKSGRKNVQEYPTLNTMI